MSKVHINNLLKILFLTLIFLFVISCKSNQFYNDNLVIPQKKQSYFPPNLQHHDWFSHILFELKEPKIFGTNDKNIEIFRIFSVVEMSGETDILTIIKINDKINLYSLVKKFKKIKRSNSEINLKNFEEFKSKLNSFQIDNFKPYIENPVDDGIQYVLEIYSDGKYYCFIRNNPQSGKSDSEFLKITDLLYKLK